MRIGTHKINHRARELVLRTRLTILERPRHALSLTDLEPCALPTDSVGATVTTCAVVGGSVSEKDLAEGVSAASVAVMILH